MIKDSRIRLFAIVVCMLIALCPSGTLAVADNQFTTQTKLIDLNEEKVGNFGVALDVDGNTAVVTGLANFFTGLRGAAFIYVREGENWTLKQTFREQDDEPMADDSYGFSAALDGDTLVVSAIGDSTAAFNGGAVYVYVRSGSTWSFLQKLTAEDAVANSSFGLGLDVKGDTIVVGAHQTDSVYVFHRSGGVWTQQQKLTPGGPPEQAFGVSAAISGQTIAIGAPGYSAPGTDSCGAIYSYVNNGSSWTLQQKFTAHDVAADQQFGNFVGISGDTIVGSAPGEQVGAHSKGAVYVFERNETSWTQKKRIVERSGQKLDSYGMRVAIDGDTIVVGNINDSTVAQFAGAGEVYVRNGNGGWTFKYLLTANDGAFLDLLGLTVAVDGDTILVGAPQRDNGGFDIGRGSVYIFR